eukprot:XP_028335336.1 GMP reductase 1 [Physeter catodon]
MPRIDADLKLDFKDVLLRPKRSSLKSRAEVGSFARVARGRWVQGAGMCQPCQLFCVSGDGWDADHLCPRHHCRRGRAAGSLPGYTSAFVLSKPHFTPGSGGKVTTECWLCGWPVARRVAQGLAEEEVQPLRPARSAVPASASQAGCRCPGSGGGAGAGRQWVCGPETGLTGPGEQKDGGCTCPGDVAKAFGAGADFVMLGGMFSGHTECAGEVIERNGQKLKLFYGMSSETAMKKHAGGVAEYRASEGKTVEVPYKGDVENTILDILGGLRSTCTYVGAAKLKELSRRATFIRVTQQHNTVFS